MFLKGSLYENLPLFDPLPTGEVVFRGVRARPLTVPQSVVEHEVARKDRIDGLGHHYYAEPRAWRRFAEANPQELFAQDLVYHQPEPGEVTDEPLEKLGETIAIPRRKETV
jgi:hypothetical protein